MNVNSFKNHLYLSICLAAGLGNQVQAEPTCQKLTEVLTSSGIIKQDFQNDNTVEIDPDNPSDQTRIVVQTVSSDRIAELEKKAKKALKLGDQAHQMIGEIEKLAGGNTMYFIKNNLVGNHYSHKKYVEQAEKQMTTDALDLFAQWMNTALSNYPDLQEIDEPNDRSVMERYAYFIHLRERLSSDLEHKFGVPVVVEHFRHRSNFNHYASITGNIWTAHWFETDTAAAFLDPDNFHGFKNFQFNHLIKRGLNGIVGADLIVFSKTESNCEFRDFAFGAWTSQEAFDVKDRQSYKWSSTHIDLEVTSLQTCLKILETGPQSNEMAIEMGLIPVEPSQDVQFEKKYFKEEYAPKVTTYFSKTQKR